MLFRLESIRERRRLREKEKEHRKRERTADLLVDEDRRAFLDLRSGSIVH
jgi:hypothetical protein